MGVRQLHVRVPALLFSNPSIAAPENMVLQLRASPLLTHNSSRLRVLQLIATPMMMQPVHSLVLTPIMILLSALPLPPALAINCFFHLCLEFFGKENDFSFFLPLLLFCLFLGFLFSLSSPNQLYEKCRNAMFKCGNISIGYPFSGGDRDPECGHPGLELHCDVFTNTTEIEIVGVKYEVLDIHHESRILRIAREDFIKNGSCHPQIPNQDSILNSEPFVLGSGSINLTLSYDCQSSPSLGIFPCNSSNYNNVSITTDNIRPDGCSANVRVPILQSSWERLRNDSLDLEEALETGFEVQWKEDTDACRKCNASGGACGFDKSNNQTFCYCPSGFESSPDSNECHRALLPPSPTNTGNNNTRGGSKSKLKLTPIIIGMKLFV
ncbi:hypothetical protein Goari_014131, partial [Gossypium aridum]|nr:hypothetical protein [Gossypium aridum]